ncbi:hypothetical protein [Thermococcus peptonophilus]|uniref:hypothetical protein n=1 Tax=Thermococcus peptonophilus TaxID=53952 RepID=UPI0006D098AA
MKGTTVAALLIVLIIGSSPFIAARGVQKPVPPRDEFLYTYFSQVLERFGDSLKYTLNGDPYGLTLANTTLYELDLLREEIIYYQSRGGVNGKASEVLPPPFYSFSRNLVILDELMLEYYNTSDPALVVGIRNTARDMESILREIENITLLNGDEVLRFDTRKVDSYLRRVIETVSSRKPRITNLTLSVTDNRPILNETVTFFGGATPENGTLTLIIAGGRTSP